MKWFLGFVVVLCAIKALCSTPRRVLVISLDAGEHTITQNVFCGPNSILSIDTYVDGVFRFTTYLPPAPPTGFTMAKQ